MDHDPRANASPERLATLAGLTLRPEESARFGVDLARILAYMGALAEVDTEGVMPLASPNEGACSLRADVPIREVLPAAVLEAAPRLQGGAFVVPKILE